MTCPHSTRPNAGPCSQCAGAVPRLISNDGPVVTIDGQPTGRALSNDDDEIRRYYARRGGKAHRRRKDATP